MKKSFFVQDRIAPCIDFAHHNISEFCFVGVYLSAVALVTAHIEALLSKRSHVSSQEID